MHYTLGIDSEEIFRKSCSGCLNLHFIFIYVTNYNNKITNNSLFRNVHYRVYTKYYHKKK